jgi:predicted phosphatase
VRPRVGTFEMLMYVVLVLRSERGMQIKENMLVKLDHVDLFA